MCFFSWPPARIRTGISAARPKSGLLTCAAIIPLYHERRLSMGFQSSDFFGHLHPVASYLFYRSENLIHNLRDDGVAIGFQRLGSPFRERNGSSVHPYGKPIISCVNRGDSRKGCPSCLGMETPISPINMRRTMLSFLLAWLFGRVLFIASLHVGVGNTSPRLATYPLAISWASVPLEPLTPLLFIFSDA